VCCIDRLNPPLKAGETLVVLGAGGGVGLAAVELGKIVGARVIAVASSDEKLAAARAHGADESVNYGSTDLREALKAVTGCKGADVIYDPVGGKHTEAALRSLAWRGRLLVVGFADGEIPQIPANLLLIKDTGNWADGKAWRWCDGMPIWRPTTSPRMRITWAPGGRWRARCAMVTARLRHSRAKKKGLHRCNPLIK